MKLFDDYKHDGASLKARLDVILHGYHTGRSISEEQVNLLGLLDMTTLEGSDNAVKVVALCRQARFSAVNEDFPDAAAVCVYPSLARIARHELAGSGIKTASVAGAFPSGQSSLKVKLDEIRFAIEEGAEEIDTVISRGKLLEGSLNEVFDEVCAFREACGGVTLKVILETGELGSIALIRQASELALMAGADFLKTSTGKIAVGASPEAFLVMADTIREYLERTGKSVGIKAAGGIRMPSQAMEYSAIVGAVLGNDFLTPQLFRIGASSLAGEFLKSILASDLSDK